MKVFDRATVAAGHPLVVEVAAMILEAGGNAFDAIVAAGFAGAVAEPALTSLGGGGFLLARTAEGQETLFDFFVDTPGKGRNVNDLEPHFFPITVHFPGSDQVFNIGMGSVAVPGTLKGLLHVHSLLGSIPLEAVLQPAVHMARDGVELNSHQAYFLELLRPIMLHSPEGEAIFRPGGDISRRVICCATLILPASWKPCPKTREENFMKGKSQGALSRTWKGVRDF